MTESYFQILYHFIMHEISFNPILSSTFKNQFASHHVRVAFRYVLIQYLVSVSLEVSTNFSNPIHWYGLRLTITTAHYTRCAVTQVYIHWPSVSLKANPASQDTLDELLPNKSMYACMTAKITLLENYLHVSKKKKQKFLDYKKDNDL